MCNVCKRVGFLLVGFLFLFGGGVFAQEEITLVPNDSLKEELSTESEDVIQTMDGQYKEGDFTFYLTDSDKTAIITKYEGAGGDIVIPSKVKDDYTVVRLGGMLFRGRSDISSIVVPGTVSYLDVGCFMGCGANKIVLEEGVQYLGGNAFRDTKNLQELSFPDTVDVVDSFCFSGSSYDISGLLEGFYYDKVEDSYFRAKTMVTKVSRDYDMAKELINLVNAERVKNGIAPMVATEDFVEGAMVRSAECAFIYDHDRPLGTLFSTSAEGASLENIATGGGTAQDIFDAWMESPMHRSAILSKSSTVFGAGASKNMTDGNGWTNYVLIFSYENYSGSPEWTGQENKTVNQEIMYTNYGLPIELSLEGVKDMDVGEELTPKLKVTSLKNDLYQYDLVSDFSSSDSSVVGVSGNTLTALKGGSSVITAKSGSTEKSQTVNVAKKEVPLESITLNKDSLNLKKGESFTLVASKNPSDTTDESDIIWESSNMGVATVDSDGIVTAVGSGSADITAKCGTYSAKCTVNVDAVVPVLKDGVVVGIEPGEKFSEFVYGLRVGNLIKPDDTVVLYDKDGNTCDDGTVLGTGMQVSITSGGVKSEYTVLIRGDVDGDGKINSRDWSIIRGYASDDSLEGVYKMAADVNNDGKVNTKDWSLVRGFISGEVDIDFNN